MNIPFTIVCDSYFNHLNLTRVRESVTLSEHVACSSKKKLVRIAKYYVSFLFKGEGAGSVLHPHSRLFQLI